MNPKVKYLVQKLLGIFLDKPVVLQNRAIGYSLVRSQVGKLRVGKHVKYGEPYYFLDANVGDYTYIAGHSIIINCEIGKFCSIGMAFSCGLGTHPIHGVSTAPMFYSSEKQNGYSLVSHSKIQDTKRTLIGNDVYIGANVMLLDGVNIGHGAVIGAGAVVTRDIPPYAIAVGVPAKVIKYRFTQEQISKLLKIAWWDFDESKLQDVERNFFDVDAFIAKYEDVC